MKAREISVETNGHCCSHCVEGVFAPAKKRLAFMANAARFRQPDETKQAVL
jgi:hypothetical protein